MKPAHYGKNDANKEIRPANNIIGLDTRAPKSCEECLYFRKPDKCLMPGGCGR